LDHTRSADRTVSNNLYRELTKRFGENATRAQKLEFYAEHTRIRLVIEGFKGYGEKVLQLFTKGPSRKLGKWFTPSLFDGVGAVITLSVVGVLVWIYRKKIRQLFIDAGLPL
jgi:hypothetical protein